MAADLASMLTRVIRATSIDATHQLDRMMVEHTARIAPHQRQHSPLDLH